MAAVRHGRPALTPDEILFLSLEVPVVPEPSAALLALPALAVFAVLSFRCRFRRKTA
jgi:hypothetical protein